MLRFRTSINDIPGARNCRLGPGRPRRATAGGIAQEVQDVLQRQDPLRLRVAFARAQESAFAARRIAGCYAAVAEEDRVPQDKGCAR